MNSSVVNGITAGVCSLYCCRIALGSILGSGTLLGVLSILGGETILVQLLGVDVGSSMVSDHFSTWANVRRAFLVRSPSYNDGTVEDSSCISSVTMSVAVCLR